MQNITQIVSSSSHTSDIIKAQQLHSDSAAHKVSCVDCCMRKLCITAGTDGTLLRDMDKMIVHWHPMERGKHVFREGGSLKQIFVVRSGTVKTYQTLQNGDELTTGFMLPGDVFGLEGLAGGAHLSGATALETTSVCAIPIQSLLASNSRSTIAERQILLLLGAAMTRKDSHSVMLSMNKAHERIAAFLLNIADRLAARHLSIRQFTLTMSRSDISNYLGLSQESVSRAFAKLSRDGLIECKGRDVTILDAESLEEFAGRLGSRTYLKAG